MGYHNIGSFWLSTACQLFKNAVRANRVLGHLKWDDRRVIWIPHMVPVTLYTGVPLWGTINIFKRKIEMVCKCYVRVLEDAILNQQMDKMCLSSSKK